MGQILDGKKVADDIVSQMALAIKKSGIRPRLCIILCGNDPASQLYTSIKHKRSQEIGIECLIHHLPKEVSEREIITAIHEKSRHCDGIIVQLPLPRHVNTSKILNSIPPEKDVDGLTATSLSLTLSGQEDFAPATPKGIIRLLEYYQLPLKGKEVTIINHSNLIGKPLAAMMLNRGATVTVCHEFTAQLEKHTLTADIVVSGVGIPSFIRETMIKPGAVIIDVGISKRGDMVVGDVDFEAVKEKASYITPVPGGIGPLTVALLLENVIKAVKPSTKNTE